MTALYPDIVVEVAFASSPFDASYTWTDISDYLRVEQTPITIRRGRNYELNQFDAGEATIRLDNRDRCFDPTYTSSPYYPNVLPGKPIRISAVWNAVTYRLFLGYVEAWPTIYSTLDDDVTLVRAVDAFKIFNKYPLTGLFPAAFSNSAITAVLDAMSWPNAMRTVNNLGSRSLIQAITLSGTSALQQLQTIADSENGYFFVASDGRVTWQGRHWRYLSETTSRVTFGDGGTALSSLSTSANAVQVTLNITSTASFPSNGTILIDSEYITYAGVSGNQLTGCTRGALGTTPASHLILAAVLLSERPYTAIELAYDDQLIYNQITVSRVGGTPQIANDTTSQGQYSIRPLSKTGLLISDDSEANDASDWLLLIYKQPQLRFSNLTADGQSNTTLLWPQLLAREINERITVIRRPPGGGPAIQRDCYIEAIEWRIGGSLTHWDTTYRLSPADTYNFFILDDFTYGILDQNVLGY